MYLAVVSVSTVGFGDVHMSDRLSCAFAAFLVFGVGSAAVALADCV